MSKTKPKSAKAPKDRDESLGVERPARARDAQREKITRDFAIEAARMLHDDKCHDVVLLDLRGRSQVTDYFVIASGTSDRQMASTGEHVVDLGAERGFNAFGNNLRERGASWILLDFVTVVVHVFEPEKRLYYDMEMLWGDAPRIEWERPATEKTKSRKTTAAPTTRNRAGLTNDDILPGRKSKR
ncbi:MAG TPA: ribosome silencing factor [Phycisphaerales bacterium]|nr:ribosome silencing factor [Phycisphaerales bacterium]